MLNTNFIITLLTILATLFCLFQGEIKEGFLNTPFVMPPHLSAQNAGYSVPKGYQTNEPSALGDEPLNGLVNKPQFGPWTGNVPLFTAVKYDITRDPITGEAIHRPKKQLGYDFSNSYTGKAPSQGSGNLTCRENFVNAGERGNSGVMVEAARNMQPMGPPPRFMVTGPKLNLYSPINQAEYAVDTQNPIVNYGCNDVYSSSGQMLKGQCQSQNVREDYQDNQLPSDMTNSCLVGGPSVSMNGQPQQPVMVDRLMWAPVKSRYQRGGVDRFRGDLLIVPTPYRKDGITDWFQTSVSPSVDLVQGYARQHDKAGRENDEKAAALGLQCNMLNENLGGRLGGCGLGSGSFGMGDAPPQAPYGKCINVTFGTDISADVGDGVM